MYCLLRLKTKRILSGVKHSNLKIKKLSEILRQNPTCPGLLSKKQFVVNILNGKPRYSGAF